MLNIGQADNRSTPNLYLICCLRDSTPPIKLYFTNEEKQTECVKDMTTFIGCTEEEPKLHCGQVMLMVHDIGTDSV